MVNKINNKIEELTKKIEANKKPWKTWHKVFVSISFAFLILIIYIINFSDEAKINKESNKTTSQNILTDKNKTSPKSIAYQLFDEAWNKFGTTHNVKESAFKLEIYDTGDTLNTLKISDAMVLAIFLDKNNNLKYTNLVAELIADEKYLNVVLQMTTLNILILDKNITLQEAINITKRFNLSKIENPDYKESIINNGFKYTAMNLGGKYYFSAVLNNQ